MTTKDNVSSNAGEAAAPGPWEDRHWRNCANGTPHGRKRLSA